MFSHKITMKNYNNENSEIKELKEKIDNLKDKINMIEGNIMEKSQQIECLEKIISDSDKDKHLCEIMKTMDTKVETFEEKLNTMQKCLTEKDELILKLETRLNNLESYEENNKKINMLQEKVSILESMTTQKAPETFKCTKCQFETNSEKGLKTHLTRKHTIISKTGYP